MEVLPLNEPSRDQGPRSRPETSAEQAPSALFWARSTTVQHCRAETAAVALHHGIESAGEALGSGCRAGGRMFACCIASPGRLVTPP